jgi:hypothetical protein
MHTKSKAIVIILLILSLLFSGCGSKEATDPAITPTLSSIPTSTTLPTIISSTSTELVQTTPAQEELWIIKYPGNFTSFKFVTSQGVIIITDPYGMNEDVQPDIVTISHDHADHGDLPRIGGEYQLIRMAGTFDVKGIKITGVAGHHNRDDKTTTNIIYVFDIGDIRLAQFASQGEMPTEAMFSQIGKVDILIIQIYGTANWKLSVEEASSIAKRLQARIVIPAHTDTTKNDTLARLLGVQAENLVTGKLMVTKADLAEQQMPRVVILDMPY